MDNQKADWIKVALAWACSFFGHAIEAITLGRIVLLATLILTCLQIYVTWRDKVMKKGRKHHADD